ncbi:hypothetical protein I8I98_002912 [Enterobacter cloacae]|nr:hypothetical protein [Enterobacter cloacae]
MKNQQTTRTASRGLLLLCTLLSAVVLSGCGDKDECEFIRGCKSGGGSTAVCGCIYDDLKTRYTQGELQKLNTQYGYVPPGFMENMLKAAQQCRK